MNKIKNKEEKPKQYKVTVSKTGFEKAEELLKQANETSKRKIRMSEVLDFAVEKLTEKDIPKIQERVYTADDKMEVLLEAYNLKNPEHRMTLDQLKLAMIDSFDRYSPGKASKNVKLDPGRDIA